MVYESINEGFNTFLCGMALGFDSLCFSILEEFREEYDIEIIACVPCLGQEDKFTTSQKREYKRMLKMANEVIVFAENYFRGCMQIRNRYLVDNSERLICYLTTSSGGTFYTVEYALKKGKEVIYFENNKE